MVAQARQRYIDANPQPGQRPTPPPIGPAPRASSQDYAASLERSIRSQQTGEPFPAPRTQTPGMASPFSAAGFAPWDRAPWAPSVRSPGSSGVPGLAAAQRKGLEPVSNAISAADLQRHPRLLGETAWPQPPSPQTQAAARDELLRRGLTPSKAQARAAAVQRQRDREEALPNLERRWGIRPP